MVTDNQRGAIQAITPKCAHTHTHTDTLKRKEEEEEKEEEEGGGGGVPEAIRHRTACLLTGAKEKKRLASFLPF